MKILVINPNTTVSMTNKIATVARAVARPDTEIIAASSHDGPASIQGFLDVATCVPGLLKEVRSTRTSMQSSLHALTTPVWTLCARLDVRSRSGYRRSGLSRCKHDREQVQRDHNTVSLGAGVGKQSDALRACAKMRSRSSN